MTSISKSQIDQLGERLKKGELSDDDLRQLDAYRLSFAGAYEEVVAVVREATHLDPTGRPAKSTTSIIDKLHRESIRLTQMQDIAGCRLVVDDIIAQDQLVELLNKKEVRLEMGGPISLDRMMTPGHSDHLKRAFAKFVVVDRRKQPSYGYRAVHIIAMAKNKPVEIQVRTSLQHLWAQLSEKLSDAFDPTIKYGGGEPLLRKLLSETSDWIGGLEALELERSEVEPIVAELLHDKPSGEALDLKHRLQRLREEQTQMREDERQSLVKLITALASLKGRKGD